MRQEKNNRKVNYLKTNSLDVHINFIAFYAVN